MSFISNMKTFYKLEESSNKVAWKVERQIGIKKAIEIWNKKVKKEYEVQVEKQEKEKR